MHEVFSNLIEHYNDAEQSQRGKMVEAHDFHYRSGFST